MQNHQSGRAVRFWGGDGGSGRIGVRESRHRLMTLIAASLVTLGVGMASHASTTSEEKLIDIEILSIRMQNTHWQSLESFAQNRVTDDCEGPWGPLYGSTKILLSGVVPIGSYPDLSPRPMEVSPQALLHGPIYEVLPLLELTRDERSQVEDLLEVPTEDPREVIRRAIRLQKIRVQVAHRMYAAAILDHQSKDTALDRYVWGPEERCSVLRLQLSQAREMQTVGMRLIGMYSLLKMKLSTAP